MCVSSHGRISALPPGAVRSCRTAARPPRRCAVDLPAITTRPVWGSRQRAFWPCSARACIAREASVASLKMRSEPRSGLRSRCRCWSRTSVSSRGLRPRFRPSCNSHVPHLRAHGPVSGVTIACGAPPKVECPGNNYGCIDCTQFWSDPSHGIGVALEAVQSTPAQPSRVLAWKQVTVTPKPSAEGTTFGKTCRGVSLTALQACTFLYNTWVVIVPFLI